MYLRPDLKVDNSFALFPWSVSENISTTLIRRQKVIILKKVTYKLSCPRNLTRTRHRTDRKRFAINFYLHLESPSVTRGDESISTIVRDFGPLWEVWMAAKWSS